MPPDAPAPAPPPAAGAGPSTSAAAAGGSGGDAHTPYPSGYKHQPYRPPDMPRRM